jgi:hypothetical protein
LDAPEGADAFFATAFGGGAFETDFFAGGVVFFVGAAFFAGGAAFLAGGAALWADFFAGAGAAAARRAGGGA